MNTIILILVLSGTNGQPITAAMNSMKACKLALYEATVRGSNEGYCIDSKTGETIKPYDLRRQDGLEN